MKAKELRDLTNEELLRRERERKNDLFAFRMQLATGVVDNVRSARMARRDIARIKTIMKQREQASAKGTK
ncbi:MAG TPA: 50S ribosomal protein L29 [Candidatus Hydrogenedentes bacterium]|nr:50S ribosomal protein L29 [Candidatus Hydrogenedentota bacterium]